MTSRGGGNGRGRKKGTRALPDRAKEGASQPPATRARHETSAGGVVFRQADGAQGGHVFLLIRDSYGNWGFPKGHLERGERADRAALREVMEEAGLRAVTVVASIDTIEWFFRFRGSLIHKRCQFFLMESATAETKPQKSEGITACDWVPIDEAVRRIGYENARGVLRRANEMVLARAGAVPTAASDV
jgi:8-oxo-dGTP pyrophosphatase MutT (NUDIX family)